ncbi:MAG: hypothetical protein RLZZ84_1596 [Pseudomonadota bacterium]
MARTLLKSAIMKDFLKGRTLIYRACLIAASFVAASPAWATASTGTPDAGDFALFSLGVTGLMFGHYAARRRPPEN